MVAGNKRILVVDDEQIVRDSCERVLTDAGYVVHTAATGSEALAACRRERFDVMLTDLRMPDSDGLEIARAMNSEFPDIRVIVITGFPSQESVERAERLGVYDYLSKPLSPRRLKEATADVLTHPSRFRSADFGIPAPGWQTSPAAGRDAPQSDTPAPSAGNVEIGPAAVPPEQDADSAPESAEADISTLKALGLLAVAPLAGLAFVVFLPLIGFGMLFAAIGTRLGLSIPFMQE